MKGHDHWGCKIHPNRLTKYAWLRKYYPTSCYARENCERKRYIQAAYRAALSLGYAKAHEYGFNMFMLQFPRRKHDD